MSSPLRCQRHLDALNRSVIETRELLALTEKRCEELYRAVERLTEADRKRERELLRVRQRAERTRAELEGMRRERRREKSCGEAAMGEREEAEKEADNGAITFRFESSCLNGRYLSIRVRDSCLAH